MICRNILDLVFLLFEDRISIKIDFPSLEIGSIFVLQGPYFKNKKIYSFLIVVQISRSQSFKMETVH